MKKAFFSAGFAAAWSFCSVASVVDLGGTWRLEGLDGSNHPIGCAATVPGCVHSALIEAKLLPDPYWADNEKRVQWVGRHDWTLSRTFEVSESLLAQADVTLFLEDVDTFCTLFINGREIGRTDNRFRRWRFPVKEFLRLGVNEIKGVFASSELESIERSKAYPRRYSIQNPTADQVNLIRKPQCHGGWDWGPTLMLTGFCGPVRLVGTDRARIDATATTVAFSGDYRSCDVRVAVEVFAPVGGTADFRVSLGERSGTLPVTLVPGTNRLEQTLHIDRPRLWWPRGQGEATLYDLEVSVADGRLRRRVGLRKIELVTDADGKDGNRFLFRVNGREVFCKGTNWIPSDALEHGRTDAGICDLLKSAADANMNMVRLWGGGVFEKDSFYDACDELGLLVWHDFMFACGNYPDDAAFLASVRAEIADQLARLRDHPSIALWCGDNECFAIAQGGVFPEATADPAFYLSALKNREQAEGEVARAADPSRAFWPSSPCSEASGYTKDWGSDAKGDVHIWRPWWGDPEFDYFYSRKVRFCDEFGYQSFPSPELTETFLPEGERNPLSDAYFNHQKAKSVRNGDGTSRLLRIINREFLYPDGQENAALLSQILQGIALRTAIHYWRSLRPYCMGAMVWQLNDCWPAVSWSTVEYGGKWKASHYVLKRIFEPVTAYGYSADNGTNYAFFAMNDTPDPVRVRTRLSLRGFGGTVVRETERMLTIPAGSVTNFCTEVASAFGTEDERRGRFVVIDTAIDGRDEPIRTELLFAKFRHAPLAVADVRTDVREAGGKLVVAVTADAPAFHVWLNARGIRGEFSDNSFTLLPGERRIVSFEPKEEGVGRDRLARALTVTHVRRMSR